MASSPFGAINSASSSSAPESQVVTSDAASNQSESMQEPTQQKPEESFDALKAEVAALREALAAKAQQSSSVAVVDSRKQYRVSCLPIQRYHLGRFHFNDGYLSLGAEDYAEFKSLLSQQPLEEQYKFSLMPADYTPEVIQGTKMVAGIDTTANSLIDGAAIN